MKSGGFPDIIIWEDRAVGNAFSFVELKIPGKTEDLSKLNQKAENLKVKYAFISNFQYGCIYEIKNNELIVI